MQIGDSAGAALGTAQERAKLDGEEVPAVALDEHDRVQHGAVLAASADGDQLHLEINEIAKRAGVLIVAVVWAHIGGPLEAEDARLLAGHPDVEAALERLEGLAAGQYDGMAWMSPGDESPRHRLRH